MRIEQLEYVEAVTRHGSLRRASEHLHVSQPALGEALGKLERELGVVLLDRHRSGTRINTQGQELLPAMLDVLDAVARLRAAASGDEVTPRALRVGTVNAGTSAVLVPAIDAFRREQPGIPVDLVNDRPGEIHQGLAEGTLDLGLVNVLPGDDVPVGLAATPLTSGQIVLCLRTDHPLADADRVEVEDLLHEPYLVMRQGHLMHRVATRLFDGRLPATTYSIDGAEVGKLMVAQGLGVTILPDYSIDGDPLVEAGLITHRPLAADDTDVALVLLHRRSDRPTATVVSLRDALVAQASRG